LLRLGSVALGALAAAPSAASDFSTGGAFLPLGHGARAYALGGAGVALIRDDSAVYWNPANIAWASTRNGLTFMHAEILPSVNDAYNTLSYGRAVGPRLGEPGQIERPTRWGVGVFFSHMGFDFESGKTWSENLILVGGSYAVTNYASVGIGLKVLRALNDFDTANATGAGLDLGLTVVVFENLTASLVGRDVWTRVSWDTSKWETLAPAVTLGFEYRPVRRWAAVGDFILRESAVQRGAAGLEWQAFRDLLWLRAGATVVIPGGSRTYPSAGIGLHYRSFFLDYAASFDEESALETGHRASLRVQF
jgi:hypothetical protein